MIRVTLGAEQPSHSRLDVAPFGQRCADASAARPAVDRGVRQVGRPDSFTRCISARVASSPDRSRNVTSASGCGGDQLEPLVGGDPRRRTPGPARRACGCARAAPPRRTSGSPTRASARGSGGRAARASRGSRSPRRTRWRRCAGTRAGSTGRRAARARSATQNASQSKLVSSHLCGLVA